MAMGVCAAAQLRAAVAGMAGNASSVAYSMRQWSLAGSAVIWAATAGGVALTFTMCEKSLQVWPNRKSAVDGTLPHTGSSTSAPATLSSYMGLGALRDGGGACMPSVVESMHHK